MSRYLIVLNEWLIHDLLGENASDRQKESVKFLRMLITKCDKICVLKGSTWMKKAYQMMEQSDPLIRRISKQLHLGILQDLDKAILLEKEEIKPLPEELTDKIPEDDQYLVQTYLSIKANFLITTDIRLKETLSSFKEFRVKLRDEFLDEYLKEDNNLN